MCVIAYIPAGIKVSKDRLENCFNSNPDGAGFMFQDKKHNQVTIRKGYMTFKDFWYDFSKTPWNVDRVAHFRIATSGKVDAGCCHPFPLVDDYKEMRRTSHKSKIAVAHNGVISWTAPTDGLQAIYSDTMSFIKNHMLVFKDRLFLDGVGDVIQRATNSKFVIMSANQVSIIGKFESCDGVLYSNSSYEEPHYYQYGSYWTPKSKAYQYTAYNDTKWIRDLDDTYDWFGNKIEKKETLVDTTNLGDYELSFTIAEHDLMDWDLADYLACKLEKSGAIVDDYYLGFGCIVVRTDCLPKHETFYGFKWYELKEEEKIKKERRVLINA